ncbi:MAG: hypothetical protein HOG97_07495, partial [Candidatus Marinimicrobia bacterium]|nr:hypothetical protein [Candidatus Neomarinimicrobiota bacterium]
MPKKFNQTLWLFIMGFLVMSCTPKEKTIDYPFTRTVNQIDNYFGTNVSDPYRWLED